MQGPAAIPPAPDTAPYGIQTRQSDQPAGKIRAASRTQAPAFDNHASTSGAAETPSASLQRQTATSPVPAHTPDATTPAVPAPAPGPTPLPGARPAFDPAPTSAVYPVCGPSRPPYRSRQSAPRRQPPKTTMSGESFPSAPDARCAAQGRCAIEQWPCAAAAGN